MKTKIHFQPRKPYSTVKNRDGYLTIYIPAHDPFCGDGGFGLIGVPMHRYVMARMLQRPLRPGENVHHKNGRRHDNRPENLELWRVSQPAGQRLRDSAIDYLLSIPEHDLDAVIVHVRQLRSMRKVEKGPSVPQDARSAADGLSPVREADRG